MVSSLWVLHFSLPGTPGASDAMPIDIDYTRETYPLEQAAYMSKCPLLTPSQRPHATMAYVN